MSLWIEHCYHWSPATRRKTICRRGLVPFSPRRERTDGDHERLGYICAAMSPRRALTLLPEIQDPDGEVEWDLYQITPAKHDDIGLRVEGTEVMEIRFFNVVPPDRVFFLATRVVF